MKYFLRFAILFFLISICNHSKMIAQKRIADSLGIVLITETVDTNKVNCYWRIAYAMYTYNPDSAMTMAHKGLRLAKKINYVTGKAKSTTMMANIFNRIGDYPNALTYYFEKLKIDEGRNNLEGIASTLMNIGISYTYQQEYSKALEYYNKADSIIYANNYDDEKIKININKGDLLDRMNALDSSLNYFSRALNIANKNNDLVNIGIVQVGLGNIYAKQKNMNMAISAYKTALPMLQADNNEDLICETSIGLAKVFSAMQQHDSALYYAHQCFYLSKKDNFLTRQLDATNFLENFYSNQNNIDSAYYYMKLSKLISEDINSKDKITKAQTITFGEKIRQEEIAEKLKEEKEERRQQLQLILIGIAIPIIFFLSILLTKAKIHIKFIRGLGVISLLFFFEYLTLLLHPIVVEITHHTPFLEILIFVGIASIIIPLHHKLEHWILDLLIKRAQTHKDKLAKLSMKESAEKSNHSKKVNK